MMKAMNLFFSAFVTSAVISFSVATAAPANKFSVSDFERAAETSLPVIVGFHSPSCGSCKVQKPNLEALLKEKEFTNVQGFLADFSDSENFRKSLAKPVRSPSTIVVFKNGHEVRRILGITNKDELRKALLESL